MIEAFEADTRELVISIQKKEFGFGNWVDFWKKAIRDLRLLESITTLFFL